MTNAENTRQSSSEDRWIIKRAVRPHSKLISPSSPPLSPSPMAAPSSSYKNKKNNNVSSSKQPNCLFPLSHPYDHFQQVIPSGSTDLFELELEESDVFWGSSNHPCEVQSSASLARSGTVMIPLATTGDVSHKKKLKKPVSASSPVKVPDLSRVQQRLPVGVDDEEEEGGVGTKTADELPPHEYLARRRGDSFSVHQGMGRTLKGMELCRVRNEILKILLGFED